MLCSTRDTLCSINGFSPEERYLPPLQHPPANICKHTPPCTRTHLPYSLLNVFIWGLECGTPPPPIPRQRSGWCSHGCEAGSLNVLYFSWPHLLSVASVVMMLVIEKRRSKCRHKGAAVIVKPVWRGLSRAVAQSTGLVTASAGWASLPRTFSTPWAVSNQGDAALTNLSSGKMTS